MGFVHWLSEDKPKCIFMKVKRLYDIQSRVYKVLVGFIPVDNGMTTPFGLSLFRK